MQVEVILTVVGKVPEDFARLVLGVLNDFYSSVSANHERPTFVEVLIYGQGRSSLDFLYSEAAELGVGVLGYYPVSHEAWRGWPRIHVDYERCSKLEPELLKALLVHEAAHSLIHGSREYYLVRLAQPALYPLGPPLAIEVLYLASTVIKDLEVHRYLLERGHRRLVETYARCTTRDSAGSSCSSLPDALNFSKLVAPCVYVECPDLVSSLAEDCARLVEVLLKTLAELGEAPLSWVDKAAELARRVAALLSDA